MNSVNTFIKWVVYCASFYLLSILLAVPTYAWGPLAHQGICDAAWRQSDKQIRNQLKQVIKRMEIKTFADACVWADKLRNQSGYAWHKPLHYVNVSRRDDVVSDSACLGKTHAKPNCVVDAIGYFKELAVIAGTQLQRDQALLVYAHLVADVHQPLHVSYADDRGGTRRQVVFEGKLLPLHRLWDSEIVYCGYRGSWRRLGKSLYRQRKHVVGQEASVIEWANESLALTRRIYSDLPKNLPKSYCETFHPLARQRMVQASVRLARGLAQVLAPVAADKVQSAAR